MSRFVTVAPIGLALFAFACGGTDSDPPVQIDPDTKCSANCGKDEADTDQADPTSPGQPDPTSNGGGTKAAPAPEHGATDPINTCETAVDLGVMSGEPKIAGAGEVIDQFSAQGHCSKWLKIRVNEDSSLPQALELKVTLTSPVEHKFDLFGYVNTAKDELECTMPLQASATTLSSIDSIDLKWGDSWFSDDSRTVTIEVRAKGSCDATSSWSLLVSSGILAD